LVKTRKRANKIAAAGKISRAMPPPSEPALVPWAAAVRIVMAAAVPAIKDKMKLFVGRVIVFEFQAIIARIP
jgi:hypothetical protein